MSVLDFADATITLVPVILGMVAVSVFTVHLRHTR
jgi:hypothetical protein